MLTGWRLRLSKCFLIPQRWVIGVMGLSSILAAYMMRVCLSIALTQMVPPRQEEHYSVPDACYVESDNQTQANNDTATITSEFPQYSWDESTQGIILSSFFYGYVVTHIPGGVIAERYGAKHTLGLGLLLTALLTLATPAAVEAGGAGALIAIRVLQGLGEGPNAPALAALMSRWVPESERGLLGTLIFGGAQLGYMLGTTGSGYIMRGDGNWPAVFYTFGGLGVIWYIAWTLLVYSEPESHPFISPEELEFLQREIEKKSERPVPWRDLLSSVPLWAIVIAAVGHDWGYFLMTTELPKYMVDVLRFEISKTGLLSSLPYLVMWLLSFLYGYLCDLCITKQWLSIRSARKIFTSIASIGPAIFIVSASYNCDPMVAVTLFTLGMACMGAYYCGMKINPLDITPNYAGTASALVNGTGAVSGILGPILVGYLVPDKTRSQWTVVFWVMFAVLILTNIVYIIFAEGEEQWWNDEEKNGRPDKKNKTNREQGQAESQ